MPDLETLVEIIKALPCETHEDLEGMIAAAAEVRASQQYSAKDKKRLLAVISERTSERLGKLRADQERALAGLVDPSAEPSRSSFHDLLRAAREKKTAADQALMELLAFCEGEFQRQAKGTKPKKKRG